MVTVVVTIGAVAAGRALHQVCLYTVTVQVVKRNGNTAISAPIEAAVVRHGNLSRYI